MKIWLVVNAGYDYEYPEVLGVFTSEEKASDYLKILSDTVMPWNDKGIVEAEIDIPFSIQSENSDKEDDE